MSAPRWYAAGLRFSCRRCGACCSGAPGHVWLGPGEAGALAARLGLSGAEEFLSRHARLVRGAWSLREEEDGRCVFFAPVSGCAVYDVRPSQCRTWPFWPRIVAERRSWEEEAAACPGMGSGELHDGGRIDTLLREAFRPRRGGG